jgi:outer membrane protein OmpA-like peptidoglycan-associated protein
MILTKPIANSKTPEDWVMNKRVEVKVQKNK